MWAGGWVCWCLSHVISLSVCLSLSRKHTHTHTLSLSLSLSLSHLQRGGGTRRSSHASLCAVAARGVRRLLPGRTQAEAPGAGGERGSLVHCGRCGKREKGLAGGVHAGERHSRESKTAHRTLVQLVPAAPSPAQHAHPARADKGASWLANEEAAAVVQGRAEAGRLSQRSTARSHTQPPLPAAEGNPSALSESAPHGPIVRLRIQTLSRCPALLSPASSRGAADLLCPCSALEHSRRESKVACGRLCPEAVHEDDRRCGDGCASSATAAALTVPRALCAGLLLTRLHLDARLGASVVDVDRRSY